MKRFAFLCHPLDFQHLASVDSGLLRKSPRLVRQVMSQVPASHVRTVRVISPTGAMAQCELLCVWLLPDQFKDLDPRFVQMKLEEAFRLAANLECELVGLGAYTKVAAVRNPDLYARYPFAVTTGNTFTAALAVESLEQCILERGLSRDDVELTVVGCTGAIGNAVTRALAPQVARLNLVGRSLRAVEKVGRDLSGYGCNIKPFTDAKFSCRDANLIFLATSEPGLLIQATDLAQNARVVDVSKPVNILPDLLRPDVRVIDCAMVSSPPLHTVADHVHCFPSVAGLGSPNLFACFAESMVLALEGRIEAYSKGGHLDTHKFPEILSMARKHGFRSNGEEQAWKSELSTPSINSTPQFGIVS